MSLIRELKHRHVAHMALFHLVSARLCYLQQGADEAQLGKEDRPDRTETVLGVRSD